MGGDRLLYQNEESHEPSFHRSMNNICEICNTRNLLIVTDYYYELSDRPFCNDRVWKSDSNELCLNCVKLCDTCLEVVCTSEGGDLIHNLCINCNPSAWEKLYGRDISDSNKWKLKYLKCSVCQNMNVSVKHHKQVCEKCDPSCYVKDDKIINGNTFSGYIDRYTYNDKDGWIHKGYEFDCIKCTDGKWYTTSIRHICHMGICQNCDPSTELIKYEWGVNGWNITGYIMICNLCLCSFLHKEPVCKIYRCKNCNPSTSTGVYIYSTWKGWTLVADARTCQLCYKNYLHLIESSIISCRNCNPSDSHNKFELIKRDDWDGLWNDQCCIGWRIEKIWYFSGSRHGWKDPERYSITTKYVCTNKKCISALHKQLTLKGAGAQQNILSSRVESTNPLSQNDITQPTSNSSDTSSSTVSYMRSLSSNYTSMSVTGLRLLCKSRGISRFSKLTKQQLINVLEKITPENATSATLPSITSEVNLEKLTVANLKKRCDTLGIKVPSKFKKCEIIELLQTQINPN